MAIYELLGWLLILFFISYQLCGKDFLAPATMLVLTFIFSTLCAIYKYPTWRYDYSGWTTFVIITSLVLTLIVNFIVHEYLLRYSVGHYIHFVDRVTPITFSVAIIAIIIILLTVLALFHQILRVSGTVGSINTIMAAYRNNGSYSTDLENKLPQWVKNLQYITNSFSYLFSFDLIYFWSEHKISRKILDIIIIILCVITGLLSGGRFGMASLLIAMVIMYHFVQIKKRGYYKQYKLSSVVKNTTAIIIAFIAFYTIRALVGRDDDQGIFDYIGHYFGGGLPLFDMYLKESHNKAIIWGQETFYSLINNLRRLGLVDMSYYVRHHEFRYMNGNSLGNVYTAFRDYYHDFGLFGIYVMHFLFSCIYTTLYERIKIDRNIISIIVYSTIYYGVVFYPFNNSFFASTVSLGYLLQISILLIIYELVLRKKIRFRIRTRGKVS